MKIENMAVVFHDADSGKAYCKILSESQTIIVAALLKEEGDDAMKVVEVQPFELRSVKK